jgi:hypothetical protein
MTFSFATFAGRMNDIRESIPRNAVFVLGSQDAEMLEIQRLLTDHGVPFVFAGTRLPDGALARVGPGVSATVLIDPFDGEEYVDDGRPLVGIEVASAPGANVAFFATIDHHGEDFRAEGPLVLAWFFSSIGQVWCVLGLWGLVKTAIGPTELVMAGESDHNLPAFVQGRCSTSAEAARDYVLRTRHRAFAPHLSYDEFVAVVTKSIATLREAPAMRDRATGQTYADVADLLHLVPNGAPAAGTGEVYPEDALFLPVASALCGRAYAVTIKRKDGRLALRLGGFRENHPLLLSYRGRPEAWGVFGKNAPRPDNAYCDAMRGFAGGTYLY